MADETLYYMAVESIVPVRMEPRHSAEMGSQLLFGECGTLHGTSDDGEWVRWRGLTDGYEGWVREPSLAVLNGQAPTSYLFSERCSTILIRDEKGYKSTISVPFGSRFPIHNGEIRKQVELSEGRFVPFVPSFNKWIPSRPIPTTRTTCRMFVRDCAVIPFLNAPYLWGGKTRYGVDCSGLVQVAFALVGVELPRDAWQQALVGQEVAPEEARVGDLAFFSNPTGRITHVGLLTTADQILHASGSGRVRLDPFRATGEAPGIYHSHTGQHTHRLSGIRRHFQFEQ